jgi:alkylhydroperoxidase/carboxymuconolactone decarboxylase family protein YurZ
MSPDTEAARDEAGATPPPSTPICDRLRAAGEWNPLWDPFYQLDPAWTEAFFAMATMPMRPGVLDAKTIEFIAIAVDAACTHMYAPGVRRHIRKALALGATREEIAAVLQLTSVLGIHSMSLGAPMLLEEIEAGAQRAAAAGPGDHAS